MCGSKDDAKLNDSDHTFVFRVVTMESEEAYAVFFLSMFCIVIIIIIIMTLFKEEVQLDKSNLP